MKSLARSVKAVAVRTGYIAAFLTMVVTACAYGQASAGSAECTSNCGGGSSARPATSGASAANSRTARAVAATNSVQNTLRTNQQVLQNGADQMLNVLTSGQGGGDTNSTPPTAGSSGAADTPSVYTRPATVYTWQPAPQPNAASAVSALLDSDQPANSSAAAVSALLSDDPPPAPAQPAASPSDAASAVSNLLDTSKVSDSASAFALPTPADPQFSAVLQESTDQPDQSQQASVMQMLQSAGQQVKDSLTGLVSSGKTLLSTLSNDPAVYWLASQGWNGTTAPLATPGVTSESVTDTPEGVANLVQGQAVVGFGDLLNGMAEGPAAFSKALYSYGSKMVSQVGAALGFADASILGSESGNAN